MIPRDQELRDEAWKARRAQEVYGPPPAPQGRSHSTDGKCLVCNGGLFVMEAGWSDTMDWAQCGFCGNTMPCVRGVLSRA